MFYNDATWNRMLIAIQNNKLVDVKEIYPLLTDNMNNLDLLYEAIIQGSPEVVDFFLSIRSDPLNDEYIEDISIYSKSIEMVIHFINKGYSFTSKRNLVLAEYYLYLSNNETEYERDKCQSIYDLIVHRRSLRKAIDKDIGYISWLNIDLSELLLK